MGAAREFFVDYMTRLRSWSGDQRIAADDVRLVFGFDS